MVDLSSFLATGTDNGASQYSKNRINALIAALEAAVKGVALTDYDFGAIDGEDNSDALEEWADYVWTNRVPHAAALSTGTISRPILLGLADGTMSATTSFTFANRLKATAAMDHMIQIKGIRDASLNFHCDLSGANSESNNVALASRLAKAGIVYHDLHRCQSSGMVYADNFYYHGTAVDPALGASTTGTRLPYVRSFNIGSSPSSGAANRLDCNWSNVTLIGSSGSTAQTWTCTVDVVPAADPLGYPRYLKIAGYYYKIIDITGTTVTFEAPWLDNASVSAGSGTGTYVFGAVHAHGGGDNSTTTLSGVDGHRNGIGLLDESWYGAICEYIHHGSESEITATYGIDWNSDQQGGRIRGGYTEKPPVFICCGDGTADRHIGAFGGDPFSFANFYKLGPRLTNGNLKFQAMDELTVAGHEGKLIIAQNGHTFTTTWDPGSVAAGASTTTTMTIPSPLVGENFSQNVRASFSNSLQGCQLYASITAQSGSNDTCTVTIRLTNPTAGAIDLASGTLSVTLMK